MPMKIDDRPVDARVIKSWKLSLSRHDAAELRAYASKQPRLTVGFRKDKISIEVAVARIQLLRPTIDSSRPPTLSRVEFGPVSHAIFEGARTSL